jgi:hypothetical protein
MLGERECSVLVQLHHRAAAGRELAEIVVETNGSRTSHPIHARRIAFAEWQREVVPVTTADAACSIEIHGVGTAVSSGTISVARGAKRPLYNIAHMCNSPSHVRRAIREGANVVECDVRAERSGAGIEFHAFHGFEVAYGMRSLARTPLAEQLSELEQVSGSLALVVFDCKPVKPKNNPDYRHYGAALAEAISKRLPPERCLISIHSQSMARVFDGVRDVGFAAGLDVNLIDNTAYERDDLWIDEAEEAGVTMLGLGTDCHVPWDLLRSWFGPVRAAVNGRDWNQRVRKVYYWTLANAKAMRKMLDYQVDGILVNDPGALARLLAEPPYCAIYRAATTADSQFLLHGVH